MRRAGVVGLAVALVLGASGCTSVVVGSAKLMREDRSADDQLTDTKIGMGALSGLADKDKNLLLDVNVDAWEQRVLLTGTVADARVRQDVVQAVRADQRVKKIHNEIQVVSAQEQARRREAVKPPPLAQQEGAARVVNDYWIETKIAAQLLSAREVVSVNYRWRSVRHPVYVIGRASSKGELKTVLDLIRATEGVLQVKPFIEIKATTSPAPSARG